MMLWISRGINDDHDHRTRIERMLTDTHGLTMCSKNSRQNLPTKMS